MLIFSVNDTVSDHKCTRCDHMFLSMKMSDDIFLSMTKFKTINFTKCDFLFLSITKLEKAQSVCFCLSVHKGRIHCFFFYTQIYRYKKYTPRSHSRIKSQLPKSLLKYYLLPLPIPLLIQLSKIKSLPIRSHIRVEKPLSQITGFMCEKPSRLPDICTFRLFCSSRNLSWILCRRRPLLVKVSKYSKRQYSPTQPR